MDDWGYFFLVGTGFFFVGFGFCVGFPLFAGGTGVFGCRMEVLVGKTAV